MAAKNNKGTTTIIDASAKTALTFATKANTLALHATERAFTKSLGLTKSLMGISNKAIKRGLKISMAQQDLAFDVLESVKGKMVKGPKKSKK